MYGNDFTFNGRSLSEFNMRLVNIDSMEDDKLSLSRETIGNDMTSNRTNKIIFGAKYMETLTFQLGIVKDFSLFETQKELELSRWELRELTGWLTGNSTPTYLKKYDLDFDEQIEYLCICTDIQPFIVGKAIMGIIATFTCDAPYGYSETQIEEFTDTSFDYVNESDELDRDFYPIVIIKTNSNTTPSTIYNTSKNENIRLDLKPNSTYKFDCKRKMVYCLDGGTYVPILLSEIKINPNAQNTFFNFEEFNIYWFAMRPGTNHYEVTGNIRSIEFQSKFPRKVGAF